MLDYEKREIFSTSRSKTTSTETQRKKQVHLKRPNTLSLRFKDDNIKQRRRNSLKTSERSLTKKSSNTSVPSDSKTTKIKKESEKNHIYVISNKNDEYYDSIEVIDERRMKMFAKMDPKRIYETSTSICEEYYNSSSSKEQQADKLVEKVNDNQSINEN